ncbi:MAG: hypothetical protein EAZ65_02505 [Verrucomicrobia bacterium]|nr:MAG: hypothetical protein EAZ84_04765 [Verrucomicrobiota bacterium]TAE88874.1 MAG: hypothetical protein EAZ82_02220 [Verrucomicrobiota bacterium]TAF27291.1 MAG: hypothetical protein EAZ71_02185 [Verrucomicrobiota bacterium]TAF42418.1 MAG: hypothetical protein EAZ65_02505 [Verrucomicrobiota bacterium]
MLATACLEQSIDAIEAAGIADATEIARTRLHYERAISEERPLDILEILARVQGAEEEHIGSETARIAHAISGVIHPTPPMIPFAGKLIAPTAFYESFPFLLATAKLLLSPVIYAEDTDAVGTGSLNPIAARLMAEEIVAVTHDRFGIKPFVTAVRMDYESWSFLTRKHFGS